MHLSHERYLYVQHIRNKLSVVSLWEIWEREICCRECSFLLATVRQLIEFKGYGKRWSRFGRTLTVTETNMGATLLCFHRSCGHGVSDLWSGKAWPGGPRLLHVLCLVSPTYLGFWTSQRLSENGELLEERVVFLVDSRGVWMTMKVA